MDPAFLGYVALGYQRQSNAQQEAQLMEARRAAEEIMHRRYTGTFYITPVPVEEGPW